MLPLFALVFLCVPGFCKNSVSSHSGLMIFFKDGPTNSSFGFILPIGGTFTSDFLALITTPLPSGFVGFGIGNAGEIPALNIVALMTSSSGTPQQAMLVQPSTLSFVTHYRRANKTLIVPNASGGIVSISKLSAFTATSATFVFRCQNCSLAPSGDGGFHLTVFRSLEPAIFPPTTGGNATLKTDNATISGFDIPDIGPFTSVEYSDFLISAAV
ncbi:hypothetical protein DFH06DRAFT_1299142 [Mycena polygramma]|nr:hypothetical protein DFH06DRAFT_1299142 [Mycena polygramma]